MAKPLKYTIGKEGGKDMYAGWLSVHIIKCKNGRVG